MSDEFDVPELDDTERRLFAQLPRVGAVDPVAEDHLIDALRAEGFLRRRRPRGRWMLQAAAAILLLAAGGWGGARIARRASLEGMLARDDLSVSERVLLLQRTGSAYVQAAHGYAAATSRSDSAAIEVARQVLLGAAHAVARSRLDAGVAASLTAVLQAPLARPASLPARPILWF